ncbi:hypothetical protein F66182_2548 [Fusarium sp. NRRL 66182]|nr:hypothetical protein F66182_2548 [Fusarium sp. NRRL 66182]
MLCLASLLYKPPTHVLTLGCSKKNLNKGELALKHAVGLGQKPNAVPLTQPLVDGPLRPVEVGWHPLGGFAGKWFAEETGLGKLITEKVNKYPDPTQHWAVLVGDYAHQLWMLLDAIEVGVSKEFGTTLAVYERLLGPGKVQDLFDGGERPQEPLQENAKLGRSNTVSFANDVMNDNTTQLDTERELNKHKEEKKRKPSLLSRFKLR